MQYCVSKRGERNDTLSGIMVIFAMALNIGQLQSPFEIPSHTWSIQIGISNGETGLWSHNHVLGIYVVV